MPPNGLTTTIHVNGLRTLRHQRKMQVLELARLIGILNPSHIWQWESGRRRPTLTNALKLAAAMNYPVEFLFSDEFKIIRQQISERRRHIEERSRRSL